MTIRKLRRGGVVGLALAATVLAGVVPASAAPGDGSAYAAKVNVSALGIGVNVGPLAPSNTNGPTSNSVVGIPADPLVNAGVLTTSAVHDEATGTVEAKASTVDLTLGLGALAGSVGLIEATCTATQAGITGAANLADVNLLGLNVPLNPGPNTTLAVTIPNPVPLLPAIEVATLVLNEQIPNADGSLTVNAFHLTLLTGTGIGQGDIIISSVTCGPATPPIPLASGAGLWISLGLIGLAAIPIGWAIIRRRRITAAA